MHMWVCVHVCVWYTCATAHMEVKGHLGCPSSPSTWIGTGSFLARQSGRESPVTPLPLLPSSLQSAGITDASTTVSSFTQVLRIQTWVVRLAW